MGETQNSKKYDLEERTPEFAQGVVKLCKALPRTIPNEEIARQLVRSAGSVGANYIEANESLSRKVFAMRIRICRKEAKESGYWLKLVEAGAGEADANRESLLGESVELMKIFGAILVKTQ